MADHQTLKIRLEAEPLDSKLVQVFKLAGREAISQLFSFDVDIVYREAEETDAVDADAVDADALVGQPASLVFEAIASDDSVEEVRRVHGIIAQVEDQLDTETRFRTLRLRLVPRAHRLTLIETQEVFLDKSVPEIINEKLERVGLGAGKSELRLSGTYPKREFVVQYKESDLAFISRLAEHLGIAFHFEHDDGVDKMVFSDSNAGIRPIEGQDAVSFMPRGEKIGVFKIAATSRAIPATYVVRDHNYMTPHVDLTASHEIADAYGGGIIEYGGHFLTPGEGTELSRIRAEERQVSQRVFAGESTICRFRAGSTWTLEGHARLDGKRLLLVEVEHRAEQASTLHSSASGESFYKNTFRAVDAALPYRPPRLTAKPRIFGLLSGRIEPKSEVAIGEHADIDEHGRYTVRLFIDPTPLGERSRHSLPVRMIQPHAGTGYGIHFPLRPGVEVIVAFMEGDPDRPFIVGAVPNPVTPSPVTRPNAIINKIQTASGIIIEMKDV